MQFRNKWIGTLDIRSLIFSFNYKSPLTYNFSKIWIQNINLLVPIDQLSLNWTVKLLYGSSGNFFIHNKRNILPHERVRNISFDEIKHDIIEGF